MHLHFERCPSARCDCPLLSLTWMGKVPDEMPDEEGWKLNRTNYYQEGWLATGNVRGVVGVTFSSDCVTCKKSLDEPLRTNYNLRGHRSEVFLVKWNEPYQKLASCDSSGIIFVWIKYEGRWSIELINDRNTLVTDFSWSHDGRMALICYEDGFVLVGSVAGQRYWSSMLNLEGTITCGIWTPDDQQVFFGTTTGQIIVMDVHGGMLAQVSILEDVEICSMAWSCEKFKMEEGDDDDASDTSKSSRAADRPAVLAVSFKNGLVYVMKNYDDVSPIVILTSLKGVKMEWTNAGDILAVAGSMSDASDSGDYTNIVQFYMETGFLRYTKSIPHCQHPVTALTWGHNDKRLFVATGPLVHVGWVTRKVASLQLLSRLAVYDHLQNEDQTAHIPLPKRLKSLITGLFSQTIKSCFPEPQNLRGFVCRPPSGSVRYHCTMIRHDDDLNLSSGTCYTLYLEYFGGLVPLLKGKRSSKIRPEFIIYDPQVSDSPSGSDSSTDSGIVKLGPSSAINGHHHYSTGLSDLSDSEYDEGCASPRLQRRRRALKRLIREQLELELRLVENLAYIDMLPESARLVEVTSNIWGTKFKMHGVASFLPANLGQVTYKTSLLHLQPRQMTLLVAELRDDMLLESNDSTFNPNMFSEDEDEFQVSKDFKMEQSHLHLEAPIAPMTPKKRITNGIGPHHTIPHPICGASSLRISSTSEKLQHLNVSSATSSSRVVEVNGPSTASSFYAATENAAEADEFPYVDFTTCPELLSLIEHESRSYAARDTSPSSVGKRINNDSHVVCCDSRSDGSVAPTNNSPTIALVSSPSRISLTSGLSGSNNSNPSSRPPPHRVDSRSIRLTSTQSSNLQAATSQNRRDQQQQSTTLNSPSPPISQRSSVVPRWAEKACDLKYIDEDEEALERCSGRAAVLPQSRLLSRCRSHSVGHLNASVDVVGAAASTVVRVGSLREIKRRLVLSQDHRSSSASVRHPQVLHHRKPKLVQCGKSRSLDSGSSVFVDAPNNSSSPVKSGAVCSSLGSHAVPVHPPAITDHSPPVDAIVYVPSVPPSSPRSWERRLCGGSISEHKPNLKKSHSPLSSSTMTSSSSSSSTSSSSSPSSSSATQTRPSSPLIHDHSALLASNTPPGSPSRSNRNNNNNNRTPKSSLRRKYLLNSPLLSRRSWRGKVVESSDDEITYSGDEVSCNSNNYKDLESFQKAHIQQKLKKERQRHTERNSVNASPIRRPQRREFLMHNKAPLWNENSQVYQLDFGGRVTQESAKNFQIEFRGKQVMQFGRIDGNAYTLDFQYPFTAVQAFAVALANVTQRLK